MELKLCMTILLIVGQVGFLEADNGDWTKPVISTITRSGTLQQKIGENQPVGQTPAYVAAEGASSYNVLSQSVDGLFVIQTNGSINITSKLDYENETSYLVVVEALTTTVTSTATITINIEDKNDNVPVFSGAPYFVRVADNLTEGTFVTSVSAIDGDRSFHFRFIDKYSIMDGADKDYFFIVPSDGEIYVAKDRMLSATVKKNYTITVQAADTGTPYRFGTADVTVCVGCPSHSGALAVISSTWMMMLVIIFALLE